MVPDLTWKLLQRLGPCLHPRHFAGGATYTQELAASIKVGHLDQLEDYQTLRRILGLFRNCIRHVRDHRVVVQHSG